MAAFQTPRGSNPLLQTKRGKLQQQRSALNQQISKQLRLRAGAENLLRATNDKKLREQITLELSFVNSNLQLLREDLAELNTSVQIYQNEKCPRSMPLIPFGLRETNDVEFRSAFKEFIIEHYSEDPDKYDQAITVFAELRNAIKTPSRNDDGIKLMFEYYNQLCCVERRFFTPGKHAGVYYEWFDSVTGVPAMQRSVAFEKGSILFNIGALYTQLAASEDRGTTSGLDKSIEYFCRAAGVLHYLKDNFSNSPSVDMRRDVLDALLSLLLAQVQECFFDLCLLRFDENSELHSSIKLAEEAAQVSKLYCETCRLTAVQPIKRYLPAPWVILAGIKRDHYMALAHFFEAVSLVAIGGTAINDRTLDVKQETLNDSLAENGNKLIQSVAEKMLLARAHLKCAIALHEEVSNEIQMCKQLRQLTILESVLRNSQERTEKLKQDLDGGTGGIGSDDFDGYEPYEAVVVSGQSLFDPTLVPPDFPAFKVIDLFRDLGPLSVFSARLHWTPPRVLHLRRTPACPGYGFSVRGDAPVFISSVEPGGLAYLCGLKVGDVVVAIDGRDAKWAKHEELVCQIRSANDSLTLTVVSPAQSSPSSSLHSLSTTSSSCSSSASSPANTCNGGSINSINASQASYSTLPSYFSNKSKSTKPKRSQTPSGLQQQSTGIFTSLTFKNLKKLKSSSNLASNTSLSSNCGDKSQSGSSWSLRNLLFTKKYSKSVEGHLNNKSLFL